MPLDRYRDKRSAERTPEPFGAQKPHAVKQSKGIFVIQKHAARRLHYDLRLEMEGVLRSWAVPKGPSLNPSDKRLAVMVEDHPLEYGDFEGVIPPGNYGAGAVVVWDRGFYQALEGVEDAAAAVRHGKLDLVLRGFKLRGAYTLVRTRQNQRNASGEKQQWLLIKKRDEYASTDDVTALHPRSVLSGLAVEEMYDASRIAQEVLQELANLKAPKLSGRLEASRFPLSLAKLVEQPVDGDKWLFELKYDGVRALAIRDGGAARLFARSGAEITDQYPEVALAFSALPFERFAMDGEIVALDESGRPSFQLLQRRMHVSNRREVERLSFEIPVCHYIFDLLAFGDFDLRGLALERRKDLLKRLLRGEGPLRYLDHMVGHGQEFYEAVKRENLEGIIAKLRDGPYRGKRSGEWLKVKCPVTERFVIGGWTDPQGTRTHFGALLMGRFEADGSLRYCDKVGTGFDQETLRQVYKLLRERARSTSPFRRASANEPVVPRQAHFCEPDLVCEVRFTEWTNSGGIRNPSFQRLVEGAGADPHQYRFDPDVALHPAGRPDSDDRGDRPNPSGKTLMAGAGNSKDSNPGADKRSVTVTHPDKVFWPDEGYTKADLVSYYQTIAKWMLPYLKDRPVVMTRYPDGINGKAFFQKDAPGFAPEWIRTERIYSEETGREIAYFILDSAEAIAYVANLAAITIHIWSSRLPHLERPDWALFDVDPKGSTTRSAIRVARELNTVLRELGLRPYLKSSGQMGMHVVVGLKPEYTYEQARMFGELVARLVMSRIPELVTLKRNPRLRKGKVYIDYLQLGHGKTIAAPFTVRPVKGAPVSASLRWEELEPGLNPVRYNIKTMPARMARLRRDPFIGALEDRQTLERATPRLESALRAADLPAD